MNRKDIVIGFVILAVLAIGVMTLRRNDAQPLPVLPDATNAPNAEEKIESSFKVNIPDDVEKADLRAVTGDGIGIATREFENNTFTATILADLPEPDAGKYYQAWIAKEDINNENTQFVTLGRMRVAKGGWITEFESRTNYSDYNNVVISLESTNDNKVEQRVLQGSF